MKLEKWKTCDGQCCKESPLRPIKSQKSNTGKDCYFRDPNNPEKGCTAMSNPIRLNEMTQKERERFDYACLNWPQKTTPETQGSFGECCWRFVKDD